MENKEKKVELMQQLTAICTEENLPCLILTGMDQDGFTASILGDDDGIAAMLIAIAIENSDFRNLILAVAETLKME